jgi:hypothetical protein
MAARFRQILPAGAHPFPGRLQVIENLPEYQENTNVMQITVRRENLREIINRNSVLCRPKAGSCTPAAGAYSSG